MLARNPTFVVREQHKRCGGMYATPIHLRDQAVKEELKVRVMPKADKPIKSASTSRQNVSVWLACRDFALFRRRFAGNRFVIRSGRIENWNARLR
jgi:hypothetical protein